MRTFTGAVITDAAYEAIPSVTSEQAANKTQYWTESSGAASKAPDATSSVIAAVANQMIRDFRRDRPAQRLQRGISNVTVAL